jgi:hypothetical protein
LLVHAYHGVWLITGSQGIGFTAVDFTVTPLSNIRTVSASSFVNVNGVPMWWNTDGIFTCQGNPLQVQSVTINSIQTFFNNIPNGSKTTARGIFNPLEQTVQWLFRRTAPGDISEQYEFDAVLNYNVLTNAFYPWTVGAGATIHDLVVVDGVGGTITEELVVDEAAVQVVDDLGEEVVAHLLTEATVTPKTKFFVSYADGSNREYTWAEAFRDSYSDWNALGLEVHYTSFFITGYKIHGNAMMKFAPMYTYVYHEGTGQFYIQGIWDYSQDTNNGRITVRQQLVFDDTGFSNGSKRIKVRGQGKTLQYWIRSVPGEPFNIIGWASVETGNTQV